MCQSFQAQGIVKYDWKASIKPVIQLLIDNDINIIQMPCPESLYCGLSNNLIRSPKGLSSYETDDFILHCTKLGLQVIEYIESLIKSDYKILCILGIENSPSCAVNFIYTHKGMVNRKGIFLERLDYLLKEKSIQLEFIGINRKSVKKGLNQLKSVIETNNIIIEQTLL